MPRVLIPSNNCDFARYLAQAYRRAGWEVVVGSGNFELASATYDLVHLQWPEELCEWRPPSDARLGELVGILEQWVRTTKVVMTVHNLQPHREAQAVNYQRLYRDFYARVPVFAHFTETSRELALREYPDSKDARHVVTGYFNMDHLVPPQRDRIGARTAEGFGEDDFVLLVIGGLREWDEVKLVRHAFDRATVGKKRLLMCARYDETGPRWRQRYRRWTWARWLRARGARVHGFIPDAEIHRVLEAADAVVIPRFRSLNSGLPALAASFGKVIIAPRCGAYPELLNGTKNPLYRPGDEADLAHAIETAAGLARKDLAVANAALARGWSWDAMVAKILAAL